ncbi:MAG: DUF1573 domain-containing protein [Vicinamibacteria bacterium]|nr:DUF1573 domain-containing protein [Vicinamibacteria bacterium]
MKRFFLVLMSIILVSPVIASGKDHAKNDGKAKVQGPRILVEPEAFDFGRVLQSKTLSKTFQIKNVGDLDLVLERPATSCGCTAALVEEKVVTPGASVTLEVQLTTPSRPGFVEKRVFLRSNDSTQPTAQVRVAATVTGK